MASNCAPIVASELHATSALAWHDLTGPGRFVVWQVLYSYLWQVTVMHGPIDTCAILGSLGVILGVIFVTEDMGAGHSTADKHLEQARCRITIERHTFIIGLSLLDKLWIYTYGWFTSQEQCDAFHEDPSTPDDGGGQSLVVPVAADDGDEAQTLLAANQQA